MKEAAFCNECVVIHLTDVVHQWIKRQSPGKRNKTTLERERRKEGKVKTTAINSSSFLPGWKSLEGIKGETKRKVLFVCVDNATGFVCYRLKWWRCRSYRLNKKPGNFREREKKGGKKNKLHRWRRPLLSNRVADGRLSKHIEIDGHGQKRRELLDAIKVDYSNETQTDGQKGREKQ